MGDAAFRKAPVSGELAYLDPAFADASKRIADAMTMHYLAGASGQWVAFKLADGTSPDHNTAYETRIECVKHQKWDRDTIVYLEVIPGGMEPRKPARSCSGRASCIPRAGGFPTPSSTSTAACPI